MAFIAQLIAFLKKKIKKNHNLHVRRLFSWTYEGRLDCSRFENEWPCLVHVLINSLLGALRHNGASVPHRFPRSASVDDLSPVEPRDLESYWVIVDIRSLQRLGEVLLSHHSGMLPSFKPLVPFIDIVQASVETRLGFRKWNISACAAHNSSQDDLSLDLCVSIGGLPWEVSQPSLLFQGLLTADFDTLMDNPGKRSSISILWLQSSVDSLFLLYYNQTTNQERDGWRNIFRCLYRLEQRCRGARKCRWHTFEIVSWRWESVKRSAPVTHCAVDTAALWLAALVWRTRLRATGAGFSRCHRRPCLSFYQWPPLEQNRRLVSRLWENTWDGCSVWKYPWVNGLLSLVCCSTLTLFFFF